MKELFESISQTLTEAFVSLFNYEYEGEYQIMDPENSSTNSTDEN